MGATIWTKANVLLVGIPLDGRDGDAIRHEQRDGAQMALTGDLTQVNQTDMEVLGPPGGVTGGY